MGGTLKPIVGVLTFRVMFGPFACRKMALLQFHLLACMSSRILPDLTRKIDLGNDEVGMILQREYGEGGYRVWRDYLMNDKPVTAPFDINALPPGTYRLV